jgi:hypothetical protein
MTTGKIILITLSKQVKSVDDEIESVDEFDTLVRGVEKAGKR